MVYMRAGVTFRFKLKLLSTLPSWLMYIYKHNVGGRTITLSYFIADNTA